MTRLHWFNAGSPRLKIAGRNVWLWNLFNRHTSDGDHWWGIGVLQIGQRHLLFVGHCGISVLFIGRTR